MNWSIGRKALLFVSGLLVAVVAVLLAVGFVEVRRASRVVSNVRVTQATRQLADLFQRSGGQQRTATTTLAADAGVVTFLSSRGARGREQALAALHRIAVDTAPNVAAELWDANGRLLLRTGRLAVSDVPLEGSVASDSALIGPFMLKDTVMYYSVAAVARRDGRVVGRVQQVRRLALTEQARTTMTGLAGGDVSLLLGNADGDPWTDLAAVIPAVPAELRTSTTPLSYRRNDEAKRGVAARIAGTPWMIVAELPSRLVVAPANAVVRRIIPLAILIVLAGAVGAWLGTRRMTTPLQEITTAAEAIAGGDLNRRARVHRSDELGSLARSFNTMAEQVAHSHHNLEDQVADRTRALQGTNAELESFTYSVSHDLRAPLRAIHGFSRILLEDHKAQLDPEAQRLLGVIDQNTRRMGQLIDDLLAFSRLGRKELETGRVEMGELARIVTDEVRRAEPDRQLQISVNALPPARGDRALLRQVVSNLVSNAVKFTRDKSPARIEVGSRPDGRHTVYYVKDNGAGFDERYADKLFGVFQRLHAADEFEGTGVGLAIVQRIVQRHGGRVWAEGKVNEGATFFFTLPLLEE